MFNIGGGELIVIMLLALIVLGPKRLPEAARQIGKAMADLRRLSTGFQNEIRSAIDTADDPERVSTRRTVLAKEEPPAGAAPPSHPVRTEPLVAGPGLEPRLRAAEPEPPATRPPSAQARAAAKKAAGKNGTPVNKAKAAGKTAAKRSSTTARPKG